MKALRIHRFGGPKVLQLDDLPVPEPGPGEVRVRVAAASLNPVDYKMRRGGYARLPESALPVTLGRDLSGVVEAVGPNVHHVVPGEPVMAHIGWDRGAQADYAIVKPGEFAPKPETLTLVDAGSLPLAAMTAWQGLFDHGGLKPGERVLIHGGSGGVGYLAVQFARAHGAQVLATASQENLGWMHELGADVAIDYASDVAKAAGEVDMILDLVGGEVRERAWAMLKPDGRLVSAPSGGDLEAEGRAHGRRGIGYMAHPDADQLAAVGRMADEGKLYVMVDRTFRLQDAAAAHHSLEDGHPRGKVVFEIA